MLASFRLRLGRLHAHGSFPQAPQSPASLRMRIFRIVMLSDFSLIPLVFFGHQRQPFGA
jgi:hypothetical protein